MSLFSVVQCWKAASLTPGHFIFCEMGILTLCSCQNRAHGPLWGRWMATWLHRRTMDFDIREFQHQHSNYKNSETIQCVFLNMSFLTCKMMIRCFSQKWLLYELYKVMQRKIAAHRKCLIIAINTTTYEYKDISYTQTWAILFVFTFVTLVFLDTFW